MVLGFVGFVFKRGLCLLLVMYLRVMSLVCLCLWIRLYLSFV